VSPARATFTSIQKSHFKVNSKILFSESARHLKNPEKISRRPGKLAGRREIMLLCAKNQVMSSVLKFFIYRNALWVILCNRILKKININAGKFGQKLIFRKFCDTFLLSRIYQLGFPPAFMNYLQSRGLSAVKDISRRRRYCQEFEDITGS
jgi:hypothetical protein